MVCQAQFVESPAISKFPKTGTSFRAQSRHERSEGRRSCPCGAHEVNLLEQDRRLLGGFSTLLEATCPGNFEIEGSTRQIVIDAPLEARNHLRGMHACGSIVRSGSDHTRPLRTAEADWCRRVHPWCGTRQAAARCGYAFSTERIFIETTSPVSASILNRL